jgi:hypothetical protein
VPKDAERESWKNYRKPRDLVRKLIRFNLLSFRVRRRRKMMLLMMKMMMQ